MTARVEEVRLGDGIEQDLLGYIGDEIALDAAGLRRDEDLIGSGRVDSLGLLQILSFIETRYHVDLLAVGSPRDLGSVAAMAAAIRREAGGARAEGA
jgi:acyl carrier protein